MFGDIEFFKPFIQGTMNAIKVQCSVTVQPGKPYFKDTQPMEPLQLAAVIGITAKNFNGTMSLGFPEKVFLHIMSSMLGETYTVITKDLSDGVGELLNIAFGQAKVVLNQKGHEIQMALPLVMSGQGLTFYSASGSKSVIFPMITDVGSFYVEICAKES